MDINLFPTRPLFLHVCITSLLKILGKEEIARNERFLSFLQCFPPFLAHLSMECSVSYCDHSPSVVVHLAVRPTSVCPYLRARHCGVRFGLGLATIHMPIRARMILIMGQIEPEHPELFALEFGKIAESDFVYTLASTNIDQSKPNMVKIYVTIRSLMSSIMDLIKLELFGLSALKFENLPYLTLFTL